MREVKSVKTLLVLTFVKTLTNALKVLMLVMWRGQTAQTWTNLTLAIALLALQACSEVLDFNLNEILSWSRNLIKGNDFPVESTENHSTCSDIDECESMDSCPSGFICVNNMGSYKCIDWDECADNSHMCNETTSTCYNSEGSYNCTCSPGYEGVVLNSIYLNKPLSKSLFQTNLKQKG